MLVAEDKLYSS